MPIKSLVFPESLEMIGCEAFYGCSDLENVIFKDTADWYTSLHANIWKPIDVTDPSINARNLASTYAGCVLEKRP